jgi:hypothetical protein
MGLRYTIFVGDVHGVHDDTTGKMMIAVRFDLCRAYIFGRTAKRSFAVRIFHGARLKKTPGKKIVCRAFLFWRTANK